MGKYELCCKTFILRFRLPLGNLGMSLESLNSQDLGASYTGPSSSRRLSAGSRSASQDSLHSNPPTNRAPRYDSLLLSAPKRVVASLSLHRILISGFAWLLYKCVVRRAVRVLLQLQDPLELFVK